MRRNECSILLILLVILTYLPAHSQEEFVGPPAKLLTNFTFRQFSGGVIVVKGRFNNHPDSLNFILDTGSGGISLDSVTCKNLNVVTQPSDKTIRGIAGIRNVRFAYNNTLHLPGLRVDSLNFHINDYEILTSVYGEHIDGIIGYNFLSRYIVKINYDSSRISIYSKGSIKYPRGGFLLRPQLLNIPIQGARLKEEEDISARFYFDTGAGLNLLLSSDFVSDSLLFGHRKKMWNTQAEGLGGKTQMKLTTVKEFRLGPYKFKNVPTFIFDDDYNVTSYPYLAGLIGNDILRRFNVTMNYDRREIYLIPNSHYREAFDYGYTGLSFYYIDGYIRVTEVMEGSPAEAAGFKPEDILISVDNNMTQNVQAYKNLLQGEPGKIKIVVLRDAVPIELTLRIKSIKKKR